MIKGLIISMLYIYICGISIFFIKKKKKIIWDKELKNCFENKVSLMSCIVISFLFMFFNIFATKISKEYGYDRLSYIYEYTTLSRSTTSIALDFLFEYMNKLGLTIQEVFYLTTFICVLLTLLAYNISERTNYKMYLLMLTSEWILFTITALKQAYACALAALFFVIVIENKKKTGTILSIIIVVLIVMFHISGLILIPLLLLRKKQINSYFIKILTIILILGIFEFDILMFYFQEGVKIFFPEYGRKIGNYLQLLNLNFSGGFLKYFYIYYIAIWGIIMGKKYSKIIVDYNKYLLLTVIGAFLILYSIKIYWFTRFIGLFYFPIFIFYQMLNNQIENDSIKKINNIIVYGSSLFFLLRKIMLIYINYGFF